MSGLNQDDIIRMAREAGLFVETSDGWDVWMPDNLETFAALIAAAEREKWKWEELHTCHPHCDRPACVAVRRAREDEREMCAKVCEAEGERVDASWVSCAFAIRERGAP